MFRRQSGLLTLRSLEEGRLLEEQGLPGGRQRRQAAHPPPLPHLTPQYVCIINLYMC
jgi:hypothetical protein